MLDYGSGLFLSCLARAEAKDLKVSLAVMPVMAESKDKGILLDLVKAMAEEYKGGKITWDVVPIMRSLDNVEKGRVDIHMPYIKPDNPQKVPWQ